MLGIVGILVGLIPIMFLASGTLAVLAITFGSIGIRRAKRGEATNRGMAITGLITGLIAAALAAWGIFIVFSATNKLADDLSKIGTDTTPAQTQSYQRTADLQLHRLIHQGNFIGNQ